MASDAEIHELVVSIRPDGMDDVNDKLDDTRESFSETADDVGESTELLSDFSNKFTGAGLVFAGAFGTLVAAVATKLPILREVGAGVNSILTSLALAVDEDVRPALGELTKDFFDLSEEIANAEGSAEGFGLLLGGVASLISQRLTQFDPEIAADVTVDFAVEVGAVAVDRAGLKTKIAEAMDDPVPLLKDVLKLLQFPTTFAFNLGISIGEEIADGITNIVEDAFQDARERLENLRNPEEGPTNLTLGPPTETTLRGLPSGREGRRQFRASDPAITSGGQVVVTGTLDSETNVDSQTVAKNTKPFTVRGVLNGGRAARLR